LDSTNFTFILNVDIALMLNRATASREFFFTIILPLLGGLLFYGWLTYMIDAIDCVSRTGALAKILIWLNNHVSYGADDPSDSDVMALSFALTFLFGTIKSITKDVEVRRRLNRGYWISFLVFSFSLVWGALIQVKMCVN
jgi:hypothetical protein